MSKLLLTTLSAGIILLDTETKTTIAYHDFENIYGATLYKEFILLGANDGRIHVLDSELKHLNTINLNTKGVRVADLHDIQLIQGRLYAVDSSTNTILVLDPTTLDLTDEIRLFTCTSDDKYHINCLTYHEGYVYLSLFKLIVSDLLNQALDTALYNKLQELEEGYPMQCNSISADMGGVLKIDPSNWMVVDVLAYHLRQPHTVRFINGTPVIANSAKAQLCNASNETIVQFSKGYYVRGLANSSGYLYVGGSVNRKNNITKDKGAPVVILDKDTFKFVSSIRIPADYIYDIIILEE